MGNETKTYTAEVAVSILTSILPMVGRTDLKQSHARGHSNVKICLRRYILEVASPQFKSVPYILRPDRRKIGLAVIRVFPNIQYVNHTKLDIGRPYTY
jgi:hypothetical protein